MKLLVANRGEVALRVIQAAHDRSVPSVAVYAADDVGAAHVARAGEAVRLVASGPAAYLDGERLVEIAVDAGCTHVHPGYGFLSEDPGFARACLAAGLGFVGPSPAVLEVFGDKVRAREAAGAAGVPVLDATVADASVDDVRRLLAAHPRGVIVKARAGGGGRGLRIVREAVELDAAYARCAAEAGAASGRSTVFAEELFVDARHIEVQVVAAPDGDGVRARAVGDRDCSVQRNLQKIVEIAPAQGLTEDVRARLHAAAARLCSSVGLTGLGTVEFLVGEDRFAFIEVNPRLQVEHTVTEEVTGVDLVQIALAIADGASFAELGLPPGVDAHAGGIARGTVAEAAGIAVQCRLNAETVDASGRTAPGTGTLEAFVAPTGRGVRVETHARPALVVTGRYDSLLAKIVVHVDTASFPVVASKMAAALAETVVDGLAVNLRLLRAIVDDAEFRAGPVTTGWLTASLPRLASPADLAPVTSPAGQALDASDTAVAVHVLGTIIAVAAVGTTVAAGDDLVVLESMKMHHSVVATSNVTVSRVFAAVGDTVDAEDVVLATVPAASAMEGGAAAEVALDGVRPDLAEVLERHRLTGDEARSDRLERIRGRQRRSTRENIAALVDPGSFVEYGALAVAAHRRDRPPEEALLETAADGVIAGTATVNGSLFPSAPPVVVVAYDYSVVAGTQGRVGHTKTDRMLALALRRGLPMVWFAEGGGGRPNDFGDETTGLTGATFQALARLRGRVPLVAIVSGRCFAGNAAIAGTCDVIIATPDTNIGMGGPAMIEGGGLGRVTPDAIGPVEVQTANGVIDIVAADEAEAVVLAQRYLGFFQGRTTHFEAPDPRLARHAVPPDRLRAYDIRAVIAAIADVGSTLELRPDHGRGIVTSLLRVEGHPIAVVANDSRYLGGAIDAVGARKAVEFLRIARDFHVPVLSLVDTPGFMVGPAAEVDGGVRAFSALFAAMAELEAPTGAIIVRKGYGLGAVAMTMGHFWAPDFTLAWPTGEVGPMGLEGAVRLANRRELEAISDPDARQAEFDRLVAYAYERGRALFAASIFEIDDVIDPAESRRWILQLCRRSDQDRPDGTPAFADHSDTAPTET